MSSPKFRIAICGGGISGPTLAVTLGQHSKIPVEIYESASEIGTVGSGISVWKCTWDIMRRLGLDTEMDRRSIPRPSENDSIGLVIRRSDQPEEGTEIYHLISLYSSIPLHRTQLIDMLKSRLPKTCTIHTSKALTSYTRNADQSYTLHFADGSTAETDVLIGADGVRSVVQRDLFEDLARCGELPFSLSSSDALQRAIEPQWSGIMVYRSFIQSSKLRATYSDHPLLVATSAYSFNGKGKYIITFPIMRGSMISFLAFDTDLSGEGKKVQGKWNTDAPKEEIIELYKNWEPTLPVCVAHNVAIIGDAVHAMTTHASAGAGQAIEDAYVLGRLLSDDLISKESIPLALKIYQDIRLATANEVVAISRDVGLMYEFNGPVYDGVDRDDQEGIRKWKEALRESWRFH